MAYVVEVAEVVEALRDCLAEQLAASGQPLPARIEVRHGAEVTPVAGTRSDECCDGLAWVRVASMTPRADTDAVVLADGTFCGPDFWTLTVEVGVLRCWTFGDGAEGPTSADYLADTRRQLADMASMRRALKCCAEDWQAVEYSPEGPEGTCLGGTWTATLVMDDCDECED